MQTKYTIDNNFKAYLNILFCSQRKITFPTLKKKLAYVQLKTESYLIIQKLPSEEIPSGSLSHFLCSEAPIVVLTFIKPPEKNSKREPHTTISKL